MKLHIRGAATALAMVLAVIGAAPAWADTAPPTIVATSYAHYIEGSITGHVTCTAKANQADVVDTIIDECYVVDAAHATVNVHRAGPVATAVGVANDLPNFGYFICASAHSVDGSGTESETTASCQNTFPVGFMIIGPQP